MEIAVNYVWMRPDEDASHAILSSSFYLFQENAKRYPYAQFNLWVEDYRAYESYALPDNVMPFLLGTITGLYQCPIMLSNDKDDIWTKVDLARLLAVRHSLKGFDTAVYSDFDVPDIELEHPGLKSRLAQYGAAFGGAFNICGTYKIAVNPFENGYMAFNRQGRKFLNHIIRKAPKEKGRRFKNGYQYMYWAIDDWVASKSRDWNFSSWPEKIGGRYVQPLPEIKISENLVAESAVRPPRRPIGEIQAPPLQILES